MPDHDSPPLKVVSPLPPVAARRTKRSPAADPEACIDHFDQVDHALDRIAALTYALEVVAKDAPAMESLSGAKTRPGCSRTSFTKSVSMCGDRGRSWIS